MSDLTTQVLIEIRDGVRATNERIDATNERLELVAKRQTESEVRVLTELVAMRGAVEQLVDVTRADRALQP